VNQIIEFLNEALSNNGRIEIRGFGSFNLHYRPPRKARNPKTGTQLSTAGKYLPHFKAGKELRDRVNKAAHHQPPLHEESH
jgi:integration host factor subunit beta